MTCFRCGEETTEPAATHATLEDCLDFLRFSVTQLNLYVARAELEAEVARRRAAVLAEILQDIADLARADADPNALPLLVRRIKRLATGLTWGPAKPTTAG